MILWGRCAVCVGGSLWKDVYLFRRRVDLIFHPSEAKAPNVTHMRGLFICRAALLRADNIILLKDGRYLDEGLLDDILSRSREMQRLWRGEA